jgi:hypothetical protein
MSDERDGLPQDWEIVAKGWTGQEVFEFLVRERRLKPADAVAEMNGRGRVLKWQIVRLGNFRYSEWSAPVGLFPKYMWDLADERRVIIFPPPSWLDLCWDETRLYGSRGRWPSHPSSWSCLANDGKVPPAELTFMTFQDQVRQLWPDSRRKKDNPTQMRKTAVRDTFRETGKPGRGGVSWAEFYRKVKTKLPKHASWEERTIQRDVEEIVKEQS